MTLKSILYLLIISLSISPPPIASADNWRLQYVKGAFCFDTRLWIDNKTDRKFKYPFVSDQHLLFLEIDNNKPSRVYTYNYATLLNQKSWVIEPRAVYPPYTQMQKTIFSKDTTTIKSFFRGNVFLEMKKGNYKLIDALKIEKQFPTANNFIRYFLYDQSGKPIWADENTIFSGENAIPIVSFDSANIFSFGLDAFGSISF